MKQFLLIVSLLLGLNTSQATAKDWSGIDVALEFFEKTLETKCDYRSVMTLTKNILHGMPSDVAYVLFSDMFRPNNDAFSTRYIYAYSYGMTLDFKNGYLTLGPEIRAKVSNRLEADFNQLTDNEFIQFFVAVETCKLAGFSIMRKE